MGFHEKLRLLYVACTRARDHLVVSVHRKDARSRRSTTPRAGRTPSCCGTRLSDARLGAVHRRPRARAWTRTVAARRRSHRTRGVAGRARRARSTAGSRRGFVVGDHARRIGSTRPRPAIRGLRRTVAISSCRRGTRAGTAPRSAGPCTRCCRPSTSRPAPGSKRPAAAQAAAEGVLGHEATIVALARSALASPTSCGARSRGRFWRETYVAVPVDGITLEGYVDLVFRDGPTASSSSTTRPMRSTGIDARRAARALSGAGRGVRVGGGRSDR